MTYSARTTRGLLAALTLLAATPAWAQSAAPATQQTQGDTLIDIILAGGWVGHTIILLSIAAVALFIEYLWSLRRDYLMPPGLAETVHELLKLGRREEAIAQCQAHPSVLSFVLRSGMIEAEAGWPAAEKAMEEAVAEQNARLYRKIEYLSVIANLAPMLGLLGTVIGMLVAFREVANTQGAARAADLAEGIYLALVTTVEGLVVAIPALAAFAYIRNRVDQSIAEVASIAQHAFAPLRRGATARRTTVAPPPVAGRS